MRQVGSRRTMSFSCGFHKIPRTLSPFRSVVNHFRGVFFGLRIFTAKVRFSAHFFGKNAKAGIDTKAPFVRSGGMAKSNKQTQGQTSGQNLDVFIQNAAAYVRWSVDNNRPISEIGATLAHDIMGLADRQPCFLPRVNGYLERETRKTQDALKNYLAKH